MTAGKKGSILALMITWNGSLIIAQTITMKRIARSVAEAEWSAYAAGLQKGHGAGMFLLELGDPEPYPFGVLSDSEATMIVVETNKGTKKIKHMELDIYSTQRSMEQNLHQHFHVSGDNLAVDILTKHTNTAKKTETLLKSIPGLVGNF